MFTPIENKPVLPEALLFLWASMIAAGAFIVVSKSGSYFFSFYDSKFLFDYFGWFLLISFLDIAATASVFAYFRAKENRSLQSFSTFLLTPVFIIGFMLVAAFLSEMFYGGSGYHGEYMFPFLQRTHY
jgi:uncharacterized membrane protein YfcA